MIYGVGTDILTIARIADSWQRLGMRYAQRILGEQELAVFIQRQTVTPERGMRYLAMRFAAKEAFGKALGIGVAEPATLHAVQTLNNAEGKPYLHYDARLTAWMQERSLCAHISLSDEQEQAIAFVVIEKV